MWGEWERPGGEQGVQQAVLECTRGGGDRGFTSMCWEGPQGSTSLRWGGGRRPRKKMGKNNTQGPGAATRPDSLSLPPPQTCSPQLCRHRFSRRLKPQQWLLMGWVLPCTAGADGAGASLRQDLLQPVTAQPAPHPRRPQCQVSPKHGNQGRGSRPGLRLRGGQPAPRPPAAAPAGTSFLCARCHSSLISFLRFSCSSRRKLRG